MKALPRGLFRAYDIRGIANEELTSHNAKQIGRSIGSQIQEKGQKHILLGRDGRISSPRIADALAEGLMMTGCHVIDLGKIPTPVLYFAVGTLGIPNGVVVTGSHNPAEYNGIKIVLDNQCLHTDDISAFYHRIVANDFAEGQGEKTQASILEDYIQAVQQNVKLQRPLKLGIDCGNGATGLVSGKLFKTLGCEVHSLYCDVDGSFPNHSPDPTQPKNLKALQALVVRKKLDIGIAFDGDGDRMIAVDGEGNILWPDRILALLTQSILKQNPERTVAYDVKCSQILPQTIRESGGVPSMCVSGHSLLKAHMKKHKAIAGGEFSGHIILSDREWGYADDGLYVAARLLEVLSQSEKTPTDIFNKLPNSYSTPEYKLYFESPEEAQKGILKLREKHQFADARISMIDGLRADFDDCWGLVRASNTSSTITLRFEAKTEDRLTFIQNLFATNLDQLSLPIVSREGF